MSWDLTRPVEQVAPELLGGLLRHGEVVVRLTEVEAYDGAGDPASHAFRGPTPRNAIMFGPPGHLYVYFSYGMHWAANIICGPDGVASGVLLRAGEVVEGVEVARSRRGRATDRDLARGPGRLTQALGIGVQHRGACLLDGGPLRLEPGVAPEQVGHGPRVGVSAEADRPWRFWVADSRFVSDYKRSPRAPLPPGPIGYTEVADIEQEVARLLAAGATSRDAPHDVGGGMLIATVTDPDGNVIGLHQLP